MATAVTSSNSAAHVEVPDTPSTSLIDLSVIIVNYNVREFLEQALRSVERAGKNLKLEVFVVDNNSVDGSVEMLQSSFPTVQCIVNENNVGFGRANNQAIRRARGRFLLILNPDTLVQEDTFETLVRFMESHPDAGAVGCKILNPDGTFAPESRRAFPTPSVALYRVVGFSRLFPENRLFGRYNMTYLPENEVAEIDALSGSCMLVRHKALYVSRQEALTACHEDSGEWCYEDLEADRKDAKGVAEFDEDEHYSRHKSHAPKSEIRNHTGAGLFDESYFMYGEDLDWCYRIQQAGWKIYYTPDTQIIHYKGESTKKGEIRYVRLFYGAMLRFIEKHFQSRYSRLFAHLLRLGILVRASISVIGNGIRRLSSPLIDFVIVYAVVAILGIIHSFRLDASPALLYFASVAPAYALGTVLGISTLKGYRYRESTRMLPVWLGTGLGFLFVATASFFIKDIAFSRLVVLLSYPIAALSIVIRRLIGRTRAGKNQLTRSAILVGHLTEARRLFQMLSRHPSPPFVLTGYVESDGNSDTKLDENDPPRLGSLRHIRDLVRLRRIDDVVFAADGLSLQSIFLLIQQLRDLPVQFKMLAEGSEHVIGKAAIDDLTLPSLVNVQKTILEPRSKFERRAFEIPIGIVGLILHPFILLMGRVSKNALFYKKLAEKTRQMPPVLSGRKALIGYSENELHPPPPELGLKPGVVDITDTLQIPSTVKESRHRTYWFYVRNQTASLDWNLLIRAIDLLRHSSP